MYDFNKILQQQFNVKSHTNHPISVKSINVCNSYSKFSEVTQKHEVSTIGKVTEMRLSKCKNQTY